MIYVASIVLLKGIRPGRVIYSIHGDLECFYVIFRTFNELLVYITRKMCRSIKMKTRINLVDSNTSKLPIKTTDGHKIETCRQF